MLENLKLHFGLVSFAAKDSGISRDCHYKWLERDPEYKKEVEATLYLMLDYAEYELYKAAYDKKWKAICFIILTKGRNRGYILNKK